MLSVVARVRSPKTDRPSPVQVHKRRGSGGLLSRLSVHAERRDGEDDDGGAKLWKEVVAYGVYMARVAQRSLYTIGWEGRGAQPTSRSCDPKDPETTQLTRPLMTRK